MKKLGNDWDDFLAIETQKPYYLALRSFLKEAYSTRRIYPPMDEIFNALKYTPLSGVKVVIVGQDPYIGAGEAHGLSFSVNPSVKIPPSLRNIYQELADDVGCSIPDHGCLIPWAERGVLLLNTVLTVEHKLSRSHSRKGWEQFTAEVLRTVHNKETPVVYLLWGRHAMQYADMLTNPNHLVLTAAHPSPLAGGKFFGCRHFSKTNDFFEQHGVAPIDWQIERL